MFSKWSDSSCQTSGWAGISPDTHERKAEVKETWNSTLHQGQGAPWYLLVPIFKHIRKLVWRKKYHYFWNPRMNKAESWISFRSTFYMQCLTYNWSIYSNKHLLLENQGVCNFTYCPVTQDFEMCFPLSNSVNRWNIGHIFLVGEKTY